MASCATVALSELSHVVEASEATIAIALPALLALLCIRWTVGWRKCRLSFFFLSIARSVYLFPKLQKESVPLANTVTDGVKVILC